MAYLNKVMLIGNAGTDPEMRFTPQGKAVTSFRMATSRIFTTAQGERRQETEWFTVEAWDRLAEQCNQFLVKGRRVYVEGRLRTDSWEGQDGQRRSRLKVTAERVLFLDRGAATTSLSEGEIEKETEDLPF
jgi:single-strand DNA-binding protein